MIDRVESTRVVRAACGAAVLFLAMAIGPRLHAAPGPEVIVACVGPNGDMRAASGSNGCNRHETPRTWNVQGPAGVPGPTGLTGPAGPAGAEGPAGRDGRDGRDGDGNASSKPAVSAQMRIDGLNSNNPTPIFSFSLGATNSVSTAGGSGGGAGKVTFANLVVSKMLDGDSVPLLQAAATGQILRTLEIDVFDAGSSVPFATYTFEDVVVTSNVLGSSTSAVNEQDAFDFRKITSDVTINGRTFHSCFDIKAVAPCS
jgi:type VI secretion system secreted protein Hcp